MPIPLDYHIVNDRNDIDPDNRANENERHQLAIKSRPRVYEHLINNLLEPKHEGPPKYRIFLRGNKIVIVAAIILDRESINDIAKRTDGASQESDNTHFESEGSSENHYVQKHAYPKENLQQQQSHASYQHLKFVCQQKKLLLRDLVCI